jgi:transcriptional regulator with XRE-family HTH domain
LGHAAMIDKDEIAVIQLVGGRLTEARELCKLPRHVAADRLGISDSYLARIESGVDVETVPLKLIRLASRVYDVSVDYLFGFSDDWEIDPKTRQDREFGAYLHRTQTQWFSRWAVQQLHLERQVEALAAAVGGLPAEIEAIHEALAAFKEMNPDFDRLPAGSQLQYRIRKAYASAQAARRVLSRNRVTG